MSPRFLEHTFENTPKHIALIMDGNGRWATKRGLPRLKGHQKGADAVRRCVESAKELGVQYLTLFAFSSENWKRPEAEVKGLMNLMRLFLKREMSELHKHGVRVKAIGDITALDKDIQDMIEKAEEISADNTEMTVLIALNYGGRADILHAVKALIDDCNSGALDVDNIQENDIADRLYTADIPDPDLVIRTSGEHRLSNFLMWQLAYAEIYISETLWPDFSKEDLIKAIQFYASRERRFGGLVDTDANQGELSNEQSEKNTISAAG